MSGGSRYHSQKKKKACSNFVNDKSDKSRLTYRQSCNKCAYAICQTKPAFFLKPIVGNPIQNYWNVVRSCRSFGKSKTQSYVWPGSTSLIAKDTANFINASLCSTVTKLASNFNVAASLEQYSWNIISAPTFEFHSCRVQDIIAAVKLLKSKANSSCDRISVVLLKPSINELVPVLATIFNFSLPTRVSLS